MDPITILAILAALALGALVTYLTIRGRGPGAADSGIEPCRAAHSDPNGSAPIRAAPSAPW